MPITIPVMNNASSQRTISPRHLAEAIGMSESSLKRWADRGFLSVTRTAGGHRRIAVQEAIRFIRSRELTILDPVLLERRTFIGQSGLAMVQSFDLFLDGSSPAIDRGQR